MLLAQRRRSHRGVREEIGDPDEALDPLPPRGLQGGIDYVRDCIRAIEENYVYRVTCACEPQLGKRGLYPDLSTRQSGDIVRTMMDLIAYADGRNDLLAISERIGAPLAELYPVVAKLAAAGLLERLDGDGA